MMSLQPEIQKTIEQIRNNPLNHNLRLQLLQLYCVAGQWESALKTLNSYLKLNPTDQQTRTLFLGNIECELQRLDIVNHTHQVVAYTPNQPEVALQQQILQQCHDPALVNPLFLELHAQAQPSIVVQCHDHSELKGEYVDTDVRFSHIVEIFEENRYTWLSLAEIESISFKPTEILTDLIWRRTSIVLKNKQNIACFVPVRYPFEHQQSLDEGLLYARSTQWESVGDFSVAVGQRTLTNTEVDIGILDITNLHSIEHS